MLSRHCIRTLLCGALQSGSAFAHGWHAARTCQERSHEPQRCCAVPHDPCSCTGGTSEVACQGVSRDVMCRQLPAACPSTSSRWHTCRCRSLVAEHMLQLQKGLCARRGAVCRRARPAVCATRCHVIPCQFTEPASRLGVRSPWCTCIHVGLRGLPKPLCRLARAIALLAVAQLRTG